MKKDIISFIKQKDYKFIKELGRGGLGKTILILDHELNEQFVCKKYSPYDETMRDEYYNYFRNEIKVMYQVNQPNIVRIFNYYLYPELKTGYILMEYVDGKNIIQYLKENPSTIDYVFEQVVEAFKYLENHQILHRDIRQENILVDINGQVKVIDFGFGKKINTESDKKKSISLNWWCDVPAEFSIGNYDHKTELYFIGKLFEYILAEGIDGWDFYDFKYKTILEKMIKFEPEDRYSTFSEVQEAIIEVGTSFEDLFTYQEKETYKEFISKLVKAIANIYDETKYYTDLNRVIAEFENIHRANILEDTIQNTGDIVRIFLNGQYMYYNKPIFGCNNFKDMMHMLKSADKEKTNILMLNIQNRLNQIKRTTEEQDDDVPF